MLPAMNRTTPTMKSLRRPSRSPKRPLVSNRAASTTEYKLLTHWASLRSRWRSLMMVGRETPTMVPSMTIMDRPAASTPSPAHVLREGPVADTISLS